MRCVRSDRSVQPNSLSRVSAKSAGPSGDVTLFAPLGGTTAYLIDMSGNNVREWKLFGKLGYSVYIQVNSPFVQYGGINLFVICPV